MWLFSILFLLVEFMVVDLMKQQVACCDKPSLSRFYGSHPRSSLISFKKIKATSDGMFSFGITNQWCTRRSFFSQCSDFTINYFMLSFLCFTVVYNFFTFQIGAGINNNPFIRNVICSMYL